MFDQLVESKNTSDGSGRRGGLFLITTLVLLGIMSYAMYYSLFNKDYGLGSNDLELSELVAPVPVSEEEPPPPEPEQPKQEQQKAAPNADVRERIQDDVSIATKIPDEISTKKDTTPARNPNNRTVQGDKNLDSTNAAPSDYKGEVSTNNDGAEGPGGVVGGSKEGGTTPTKTPPPLVVKTPEPPKPVVPKKISGGVLNGKATSLPKPPYPAAARAVRASGAVNVQVTISESGSVVSASAVSGHPLLRQAAEQAARGARFAPTLLSGQPVSVTGVIVYNFVP